MRRSRLGCRKRANACAAATPALSPGFRPWRGRTEHQVMKHALVTGAAGFIGSTLADRLLADGVRVTGVDAFTDYYDVTLKRGNLESARRHATFALLELDLAT